MQATEQGLERGAALLQPISGVRGGEEHRCGESRAAPGEVQAKAHSRQQRLPPRDPAHLTGARQEAEPRVELSVSTRVMILQQKRTLFSTLCWDVYMGLHWPL